jgi:hypothetical protein
MISSRRSLLAAGATGALALDAGCLDFAFGDGPFEFDAERVAPTETALADAGYEEREVDRQSIEQSFDVGIEREVRASFWSSVYAKRREYEDEQRETSLFAAVSVPGMRVAGRSINPLADLSSEELLEEFLTHAGTEYGSIENVSHETTFGLEILGSGREVDTFVGETSSTASASTSTSRSRRSPTRAICSSCSGATPNCWPRSRRTSSC